MTDQMIPADKVRKIIARYRDGASHQGGLILDDLKALLPTPTPPTLADMTDDERDECAGMQADLAQGDRVVILDGTPDSDGLVQVLEKSLDVYSTHPDDVTPRPDLPRMEWPGEATVPPNTLTEGSQWDDVDKLSRACDASGLDQIVVTDKDGDASVWGQNAGWWEGSTPTVGYEPFTILHAGKKADQ